MKKRKILDKVMLLLLAGSCLAVILPPFILLIESISRGSSYPMVLPKGIDFGSFDYVFHKDAALFTAVINTILIGVLLVAVDLLLALPAAYALVRYEFKGKTLIKLLLFAPLVVPPFTAIMGLYFVFLKLGLTENIFGVVLAHIVPTLPYMLRSIMTSLETLDQEMERQAQLLGARSFKRFTGVALPQLLPGIFVGAFFTFLISISQYFLTLLVGGGQVITLSLLLVPFINGGDKSTGAVYGIVFSLVAVMGFLLMDMGLRRYYRKRNNKVD